MDHKIYLLLSLMVAVIAKKSDQMAQANTDETDVEELQSKKLQEYVSRTPAGTLRQSPAGENVIEKFVETLMASEKYLKMIDSVERKMSHLDTVFHDKTNSILKYLAEMQKILKSSSSDAILQTINALQFDMNQVKVLLRERIERPSMRDRRKRYLEYHVNPLRSENMFYKLYTSVTWAVSEKEIAFDQK